MLAPPQPAAGNPQTPQFGSSNYVQPQQPAPVLGQQPNVQESQPIYRGAHPITAFFHICFKVGSLLTFILGGLFSSSAISVFVFTILLAAADFWTTKNISGRILVSLRWWNEVREDGTSHWVFESASDPNRVHSFDKWFFWSTTVGYVGMWLLLVLFNFLSPTRLPMAVTGAVLGGSNLMGFLKCSQDAKKKLTQFVFTQAANHI
uniref:Golgi apparatus membrane protein TVP23 homolog n=1 Tax=Trypanosoma congolense (strain IL3000) TaxID=1068625 RepID=G0UJF2_TRYCI|nr:conserved hypothetical protein [Trypanosoma congolense IL3000]